MKPIKFSPSPEAFFYDVSNRLGNREQLALRNHTHIVRRDDKTIAIRYHSTDVVTYKPNKIILDTGGWSTVSTQDRMNKYNPLGYIRTVKRVWWYYPAIEFDIAGNAYEFQSGMVIKSNGTPSTTRREVILLGELYGKKLTLAQAEAYVCGMELGKVKRLIRNSYLKHFAIEHCQKEYVPAFLGDEELAATIERRMKA